MTGATEAQLDAGAVLRLGTEVVQDTTDRLTARAYRHPMLGDRTVVRLVPGTLGQAEDLSLEFLGFSAPETITEVGVVRQQALGFPAWALVNDPANGHHALALVKDIERLVRIAKSRAGAARDGFNELGERLSRAVPHFLPTFYEEAARAFLAADSQTYAATMFGKAREAEQLFSLQIDEDRQHTVMLEFALAGALTVKALTAYSRELAARTDPVTAYHRFRRLCLERTLGGLPPYASMHVDLRRLAKAAKLGVDEEDALFTELLAAPSITRAPSGFWTAYRPTLVRVAGRDPQVRGQLLAMIPRDCPAEIWLELLAESGATAALTGPAGSVPAEAESPDGPAGWLSRLDRSRAGWRRTRLAELYRLTERMADRLRADGVPVDLFQHGYHGFDLDLVDTVMALGVPLTEPPPTVRCAIDSWLADEAPGRRDLLTLAADQRLALRLAESLENHLRHRVHYRDEVTVSVELVEAVVAVPGLRIVLHGWLDRLAERIVGQGLTRLSAELDRLTTIACPAGLAVNPEAVRRIAEHQLGPVLGRTLRAGVLDEFGWPALDSAVAGLGLTEKTELQVIPQWPYLVLAAGDQVVVVDADGVQLEHQFRIPTADHPYRWGTILRYVDGQLLVSWVTGSDRVNYWSGTPEDTFTTSYDAFGFAGWMLSVPLPDGGRTAGARPLQIGDRSSEQRGIVASDGLHYWVLRPSPETHQHRWYEYDATTGALGRASLPAFFEAGASDGQALSHQACSLLPAPERLAESPLGYRDGLVGWRVHDVPGGGQVGESIDGRRFTFTDQDESDLHRSGQLTGAITFPGAVAARGLVQHQRHGDDLITLWTAEGLPFSTIRATERHNPFAEGTAVVPPSIYWHYFRPRDEAGSAALRAVTDDQASQLLTEVTALVGRAQEQAEYDAEAIRGLIAERFPQVTDLALRTGIAGVAKHAAREGLRLARATSATAVSAAAVATVNPDADKPSDTLLSAALRGLTPGCYGRGHDAVRLFTDLGAAITGRQPRRPLVELIHQVDHDWLAALAVVPAILFRAISPLTPVEHREALLELLEVLADSGLLAEGSQTRRVELRSSRADSVMKASGIVTTDDIAAVGDIVTVNDRRLVVLQVNLAVAGGQVEAIEHAPDGRFGPVPGYAILEERILDRAGASASVVSAFVALARANGPVQWRAEQVHAFAAAAGVSQAEATVLLGSIPTMEDWQRRSEQPLEHPSEQLSEQSVEQPLDGRLVDLASTDEAIAVAIADLPRHGLSPQGGVYGMLLPREPERLSDLWTTGPALDRLRTWRKETVGARIPVADELILDFRRAGLVAGVTASEFLHALTDLESCRWLSGPDSGVSDQGVVISVARALPWLVRRLPTTDPIRRALPRLLDLTRHRLREPDCLIQIGDADTDGLEKFLTGLGAAVTRDGDRIDAGVFVVDDRSYWCTIQVRPSRLTGLDDPLLAAVVAFVGGPNPAVMALRALLRDQLDAWLDPETQPGIIGAEHDPSRSAPEVVAAVVERHGLSVDAATLYLHLLALPDPTDRNVAEWTGWKPARLKAARAELAATDLVVEAKRARARRSLFLPGGWVALSNPHLPLELWKLPLLIEGESNIAAFGTIIPIAPAPQIFSQAWARVIAGDHPRFEELTTKGLR